MPDTLSTSPQDPCPPTDARFARARRRHVDARPGYHHPETEAEKRERYPDDLTHEGFHVGSAAVAYVRRIGEILAAYDADREDKDALHDAVRDLVRFAAWPDFEWGLRPAAPSKDWFAPASSMDFVERPSGGSIKRIVDQRAYRLFTAFEAQYVQAFPSDDAPFVPNRDAYAVLLLIQAMAKEGADANPAHEETVARFRVLQLLLANLLGLEEARRPVTVLVSDLHEKGLRTAVTIAAEVVE